MCTSCWLKIKACACNLQCSITSSLYKGGCITTATSVCPILTNHRILFFFKMSVISKLSSLCFFFPYFKIDIPLGFIEMFQLLLDACITIVSTL